MHETEIDVLPLGTLIIELLLSFTVLCLYAFVYWMLVVVCVCELNVELCSCSSSCIFQSVMNNIAQCMCDAKLSLFFLFLLLCVFLLLFLLKNPARLIHCL